MNAITVAGRRSYLNGVPLDDMQDLVDRVTRRPAAGVARWRVANSWRSRMRSSSQVDGFTLGGKVARRPFAIEMDQPEELGGTDNFANPQEYLIAALNACMTFTFTTLCALKGLEIHRLDIVTEGDIDLRGFLGVDPTVQPGYDGLTTTVTVRGSAPPEEFRQIFEAMLASSPNLHNLTRPIQVTPKLVVQ